MTRVLLIAQPGRARDDLVRILEDAGVEVRTATSALGAGAPGGSIDATAILRADDEEPLTDREREVLSLLADGLSNRGIAARLGISEHTVKVHVSTIYAKLGVGNRTEAVTRGLQRGLVLL
jgi:DNA-binding NarL/FixJ family response regulator